jgi:hypothetical protein
MCCPRSGRCSAAPVRYSTQLKALPARSVIPIAFGLCKFGTESHGCTMKHSILSPCTATCDLLTHQWRFHTGLGAMRSKPERHRLKENIHFGYCLLSRRRHACGGTHNDFRVEYCCTRFESIPGVSLQPQPDHTCLGAKPIQYEVGYLADGFNNAGGVDCRLCQLCGRK